MERPPGGPGGNLGGLLGQRITLHRKKFHFLRLRGVYNFVEPPRPHPPPPPHPQSQTHRVRSYRASAHGP